MLKLRITLIVIFGIWACSRQTEVYEFLVFRDNNIKMWPENISAKDTSRIENGNFSINDPNGNVLVTGKFAQGFKVGDWVYYPSDSQKVEISWSSYSGKNVKINNPSDWKFVESDDRPVQFLFPLSEEEPSKSKYFVVLSYEKDSIGMDLDQYFHHFQQVMFETDSIKEYSFFAIETVENKSLYFSRLILERDGENLLMLSLFGEIGSKIYDVTYSSLNKNYEKKHIIFFDMARSLVLAGHRFFSPFDPVKDFKKLGKPSQRRPFPIS